MIKKKKSSLHVVFSNSQNISILNTPHASAVWLYNSCNECCPQEGKEAWRGTSAGFKGQVINTGMWGAQRLPSQRLPHQQPLSAAGGVSVIWKYGS